MAKVIKCFFLDCGWEKLDCTSYYVNTDKKNNKDAKADCIRMGGKLVEPTNAKHNAFVTQLAEKKGLYRFWIGIHDLNSEHACTARCILYSNTTIFNEYIRVETLPTYCMLNIRIQDIVHIMVSDFFSGGGGEAIPTHFGC